MKKKKKRTVKYSKIDNTGVRSGALTAIGPSFYIPTGNTGPNQAHCVCECDCGRFCVRPTVRIIKGKDVRCGNGCGLQLLNDKIRRKLVQTWHGFMGRCYDESNNTYESYGGRGIYVDDKWRYDQSAFIEWGKLNGCQAGLQLDRIDNDGPYAEWNCRFVTSSQNCRNKRNNRILSCFGETKTATDWSEDARNSVSKTMFLHRIKRGWGTEKALSQLAGEIVPNEKLISAFGETKNISQWSKDSRCSISRAGLMRRIRVLKEGESVEDAITRPSDVNRYPKGGWPKRCS